MSNQSAYYLKAHVLFLSVGFDTITTAVSWCVMYLVYYPDIQKKLHEEIGVSA